MSKKHKLVWSGPALKDLESARHRISLDNPLAARNLAQRIRQQVRTLRDHPLIGRVVPEFEPRGFREVIVPPFRIIYEVQEHRVLLLRVWHGRRDLSALEEKDLR